MPRSARARALRSHACEKQLLPHPHTLYDVQFSDMEDTTRTHDKQNGKREFLYAAESGTLYDMLAKHTHAEKQKVKRAFLRMINIDCRKWKKQPARMRQAFPLVAKIIDAVRKLFPGVMEFVEATKQHDHRHLACNLQRTEGFIIFQMICNQIHMQRPDTFVATIHDAVLTTPDAADYVMQVMKEQLAACGLHPRIKRTDY